MLTILIGTGDFLNKINANVRDVSLRITYSSNYIDYCIEGKEVLEVTYVSQGVKDMGTVVLKVADIKLDLTDNTKQLTKGIFIDLTYVCGGDECQTDIFYINEIKIKNNTVIVQAIDLLSYLSQANNNIRMPLLKNTDLLTYMQSIADSINLKCELKDVVVNPSLSLAYPKSTRLDTTFREIAAALNACVTFGRTGLKGAYLPFDLPKMLDEQIIGITIKKYCFNTPATDITSWLNYAVSDKSDNQYSSVNVRQFFPTQGEQSSIGKLNLIVPANTNDYKTGNIDLGKTCIPQVCRFNAKVDIESYAMGSDSFSLSFNNSSALAQDVECEFLGIDIKNAISMDSDTSNDNSIKVINNMYIQSSVVYDTRIFLCKDISISYFGNPCIEVGDTITIDGLTVLVTNHTLKYTGGLRGTIEGAILNE